MERSWNWAGTEFYSMDEVDPGPALPALPDSYFWKDSLLQLLSPSELYLGLGLEPCRCVVLSGTPGSGRHTTAAALTESAAAHYDRGDILALTLRAEDFPDTLTPKAASDKVQALFDLFSRDDGSYAIFTFDQISQYGSRCAVLNTIADYIEDASCFVILIAEPEDDLPADLLRSAFCLRLDCPDDRQREDYLKGILKTQVPDWDHPGTSQKKDVVLHLTGITVKDLVEETKGFSYSELANLSKHLRLEVVKHPPEVGATIFAVLSAEQVMNCLRLCRPPAAASMAAPVVQLLQTDGVLPAAQPNTSRTSALSQKTNRTFSEDLELIKNTY